MDGEMIIMDNKLIILIILIILCVGCTTISFTSYVKNYCNSNSLDTSYELKLIDSNEYVFNWTHGLENGISRGKWDIEKSKYLKLYPHQDTSRINFIPISNSNNFPIEILIKRIDNEEPILSEEVLLYNKNGLIDTFYTNYEGKIFLEKILDYEKVEVKNHFYEPIEFPLNNKISNIIIFLAEKNQLPIEVFKIKKSALVFEKIVLKNCE